MSSTQFPWRKKQEILIRKDSLYNRCLLRMVEMTNNAGKEFDWKEVDRLVVEVSRLYVPEVDVERVIDHVTTNFVYGFTDDIPF